MKNYNEKFAKLLNTTLAKRISNPMSFFETLFNKIQNNVTSTLHTYGLDVPISEIAKFPKIKKMNKDLSFIKNAVRQSKLIKFDDSGDYIVRDRPLPEFEVWSTWSIYSHLK
jgi:hypothetical protein